LIPLTNSFQKYIRLNKNFPLACRFGLATRGNTQLTPDDIELAISKGINYLNWCGHNDGLSNYINSLTKKKRDKLIIAVQLDAANAKDVIEGLAFFQDTLKTTRIDIVTLYYVEHQHEWEQIIHSGGALDALKSAKNKDKLRMIGLTTHQIPLAKMAVESDLLDIIMLRYNAAHLGVENEVFPLVKKKNIKIIAFTCLRWGELLKPTPNDPSDFCMLPAQDWYRFVLTNPIVSVALTAPNDINELKENLNILDNWVPLTPEKYITLKAHGDRVRSFKKDFP